jgi:hypothetical protein
VPAGSLPTKACHAAARAFPGEGAARKNRSSWGGTDSSVRIIALSLAHREGIGKFLSQRTPAMAPGRCSIHNMDTPERPILAAGLRGGDAWFCAARQPIKALDTSS